MNILYAATPSISKQDLIKKAVENSFQIQQQQNNMLQLEIEYKSAMINLRAYSFYKDMNEKLAKISGIKTPSTADIIERDLILISLGYYETAKQSPMMMLPKDTRTLNLRHLIEIYNNSEESATNSLIISMNTSLSAISSNTQEINIQRSLISNLEKNLNIAINKNKYGLIAKQELDKLQLQKKIAEVELKKLNIQKNVQYEQLSKLVGEEIDYSTIITGNNLTKTEGLKELEYYISYALGNRKDVRISHNNSLFKEIDYQIATQNYGIESKSQNFRQSYITYRSAANDYEDLKINIEIAVSNAYSDYQQKLVNQEKAKNNMDIAQTKFASVQQKYKLGLVTDYDLSVANIDLVKGQSQYFNAQSSTYISWLKLEQACGNII
jgi:hypothetical protein